MIILIYQVFISIFILNGVHADTCQTPNNETAECLPLYECPHLVEVLTDPSRKEFIRQSGCGKAPKQLMICCGKLSNFTTQVDTGKKAVSRNPLPTKEYCGLQHSDDYFHTVNGTVLSQFPWLALIQYGCRIGKRAEEVYLCSGSLINQQYVLTTAFCMKASVQPAAVRLGQYDIRNDTSCVTDANQCECTDAVDFGIDKVILHPGHDSQMQVNDVALIRLSKMVTYSDYIRPICLPFPETQLPKVGNTVITTGWGLENQYANEFVRIKKITQSTLISNDECSRGYNNQEIKDNLMCSFLRNDSERSICMADAGAPVMISRMQQWYQVGIVSYGAGCDGRFPDVFQKVDYYLDWIKENLQP